MDDDFDYIEDGFGDDHAGAIIDIRKALRRKDIDEAVVLLDRFFTDEGQPR